MINDNLDTSWMDDEESGFKPGLTCHIEIENESDDTLRDVVASTAQVLRVLAAQLEMGALEDGHHPINTPSGKKIGEIYLDHHATSER